MGPGRDLLCDGGRVPLRGRVASPTAAVTATGPDEHDRGRRRADGRPRRETVRDAAGRCAQNLQTRGHGPEEPPPRIVDEDQVHGVAGP
jgi:hypothetical protein